jgi:hypothetical protein
MSKKITEKIHETLESGGTVVSFEFFPAKVCALSPPRPHALRAHPPPILHPLALTSPWVWGTAYPSPWIAA